MVSSLVTTYSVRVYVVTIWNRLCYFYCHHGKLPQTLKMHCLWRARPVHKVTPQSVGASLGSHGQFKKAIIMLPCPDKRFRSNKVNKNNNNNNYKTPASRFATCKQTIEYILARAMVGMISSYFVSSPEKLLNIVSTG